MRIGIVGLGLIGGCLALDFRNLGHEVVGIARQPTTSNLALERGIVDRASTNLADLVGSDIVFLCTPIAAIVPTVATLSQILTDQTIITDAGSVKGEIVASATALWGNFVGGHPMAGKAQSGLEFAEAGLFAQKPYILTPLAHTNPQAMNTVADLVQSLDSQLYYSTPQEHDRAVAWISHLPVMISTTLINSCIQEADPQVRLLAEKLASSGFKDTSRVGGGNPELGLMMAQYNREALLQSLQCYQQNLSQLIEYINQENWAQLQQQLITTQEKRSNYISHG
jgi:arogenate dehydrogenase (NADP+)